MLPQKLARKYQRSATALALLLTLGGCTDEEKSALQDAGEIAAPRAEPAGDSLPPKLNSGEWLLESYGDPTAPQPKLEQSEVTASFAMEEGSTGRVAGSAGCNNYFASFTVEGQRLQIGDAGATRKMCEPPLMEQESAFLGALSASEEYRIENGELIISYDSGQKALRFRVRQ